MFKRGKRSKYRFIALFFLLSSNVQAQQSQDYAIPEICIERAHEMGVFPGVTDLEQTRERLKTSKIRYQSFQFDTIIKAYEKTLQKINSELEDYKSPLFRYLQNCKNDERSCHGYFKYEKPAKIQPVTWKNPIENLLDSSRQEPFSMFPNSKTIPHSFLDSMQTYEDEVYAKKIADTNARQKFHLQMYCDSQIFPMLIVTALEEKENSFNQCTNEKYETIDVELLDETDPAYNKQCFYKTNIEGKVYLKNKSEKFIKEIQWIIQSFNKFQDVRLKALSKSLIPEGLAFILMKVTEELQEIDLRASKIKDLNDFYSTVELAYQFGNCCSNANLNLSKSQVSVNDLRKSVKGILEAKEKPEALIFQPQSYISELIFDKAEGQYWTDLLKDRSPFNLSNEQKLAYLNYVERDLFQYDSQKTSFAEFTLQVKNNPESIKAPNDNVEPDFWREFQKKEELKEKLGYKPFQSDYDMDKYGPPPYPIPGVSPGATYGTFDFLTLETGDPETWAQNIIFNPILAKDYRDQLEFKVSENERSYLKNQEHIYYPRIFKGMIKYQFARVTQAKVIREIQKRNKDWVQKNVLSDLDTFNRWVDALVCAEFRDSYCSNENKSFRRKKNNELHEKLISGQIALDYNQNPSQEKRKYIYNQNFIDALNAKIKSINEYCWNIADPQFQNNQEAFLEKNGPQLQVMIDDFYSTARIEQLMGQTEFAETLRYTPSEMEIDCFTKGVIFGPPAWSELNRRLSTPVQTGYPVRVMQDGYDKLDEMPIKEKYVASDFRINEDDFHDLEENIDEKITDEFQNLKEVYRYNELKQYEDFLQESVTTRLFAFVDYAIDHPSEEVGKYICQLIEDMDESEYLKQKRIEMAVNVSLFVAGAASFGVFLLPSATAGVILLTNGTTQFIIISGSLGLGFYKRQYYNWQHDLTDIAAITENISGKDALNLHDIYSQNISEAKNAILFDLAFGFILGRKPMFDSVKYIKNILNKEYMFIRRIRLNEIKTLVRNSSGEIKYKYGYKVEDYLLDYRKVSHDEFNGFISALSRNEGDDFLLANWSDDLKKFIQPEPGVLSEIWSKVVYSVKNAPAVKRTQGYFQDLVNVSYNQTRTLRLKELDELSGRFKYGHEIREFVVDNRKMDDEAFQKFKNALSTGKNQSDDFLLQNYGDDVGKFIAQTQPSIAKVWSQIVYSTSQSNVVRMPLQWVTKNSIYHMPRIRLALMQTMSKMLSIFQSDKWDEWYPYKRLQKETSIIRMIQNAEKVRLKTGIVTFTNDEIKALIEKMKYYKFGNANGIPSGNGKAFYQLLGDAQDIYVYRITDKRMNQTFERFIQRNVTHPTPEINEYIEKMIGGELMDDEWVDVLQKFERRIDSIEDCKTLLKVIKFSKKEYPGFFGELKNARELTNLKELGGTYAYSARTKYIIENINEFYDIAVYIRYKNEIRLVTELGDFFKITRRNAKEITAEIKKIDPDFSYPSLDDLAKAKKEMRDLEKKYFYLFNNVDDTDQYVYKHLDAWNDPHKHQKLFLAQEKKYNDYFHKQLQKNLKRQPDPVQAYKTSLDRTKVRKQTEFGCSLPNSLDKSSSDRLYQNTARLIALSTTAMGYWANHRNEEKDLEWGGRYGYEIAISVMGVGLQSSFFTKKDGGPLYKASRDILSGWGINLVDGAIYTVANNVAWNRDEKYEREFAQIIYESENIEQTVKDFFHNHPEIEQQILERLHKIQKVFDDAELKLSKGTMVDDELEETFIKAGLIDNIMYSDMEQKNRELGQEYMYHELIESGYLDESLYTDDLSDEQLREQLIDLLTDIEYESLYTTKSGSLSYPLLRTQNLGNHQEVNDLPLLTQFAVPFVSIPGMFFDIPLEIHSGNETIDRIAFYMAYDIGKYPIAYFKNKMTYGFLCNLDRRYPNRTNVHLAIATNLMYKAIMDPLKFYLREQSTGH